MLLGRDDERLLIATLLDGAKASRSAALVVRGQVGVGKSALLDDVAAARGVQVLRAVGVDAESELPFAGLDQFLRPVLRLVDDLPVHQASALRTAIGLEPGGPVDRFLVALAVLGVLSEAAARTPVLGIVDDAHWLDDASAATLLFVARRLEAERVVMLFAARDAAPNAPDFRAAGLPELRLSGLNRRAAAALFESRAGQPVSGLVSEQVIERTDGNPLALTQLPTLLSSRQLSGADPLPSPVPVSRDVERAFTEQLAPLPAPTRATLLVAAAEDGGNVGTVLAAAELLGDGYGALDAAEQAGLVTIADARVDFCHPLLRASIYHAASATQRNRVHLALAEVLAATGDEDRRAWHLATAATGPDEDTARALDEAAQRAQTRGGYEAARAALERAAQLSSAAPARSRRLVSAAQNAWLAGEFNSAADLLQGVYSAALPAHLRADIGQLRGWLELSVGTSAAAHRILVQAAKDAGVVDTHRARRIVAACAEAAWLGSDHHAGAELARLNAALGPVDDPHVRLLADLVTGFVRYLDGDIRAAISLLKDAVAVAERLDEPELVTMASHHAFYIGDDDAAYRLNTRVVAQARTTGSATELTFALPRLVQAELTTGRWRAASAGAAEAVRLARETDRPALAALPMSWLALLAAWRGDQDGLEARISETEAIISSERLGVFELAVVDLLRWARAVQKLTMARPASAATLLDEVGHPVIAGMAMLDHLEAAVGADRRRDAQRWLTSLEVFAAASSAPWALARVAHGRALLSDGHVAEALFREALNQHERARRPLEHARTRLAYGEHLRRRRRRVDARVHLETALDTFENLGATPLAEHARAELRACGQTRQARDPSKLAQLTSQELQVARFVARGLSTKDAAAQLFLSPRTIDFHLRNVFAKLGVSSRSELAAMHWE